MRPGNRTTQADWIAVVSRREQAWQHHKNACMACRQARYTYREGCVPGQQIKRVADNAHAGYRVYLQAQVG